MLVEIIMTTAALAYETNKASKLSEKALLKRERAVEKEMDAYRKIERAEQRAEQSMKKLFNLKKGIYKTTLTNMKNIFEPISTLSFLKSLKSLDSDMKLEISKNLTEIGTISNIYAEPMTTQQQIVSLLCGGIGVMHAERKHQEKELAYASKQLSMARMLENHANNKVMVLDTIYEKNEMLWELIRKLNVIFSKSLESSKNSINEHGKREEEYSDQEIDTLRFTLQLSDVICKICNSPLITEDGGFVEETATLIQKGNEIIADANYKISARKG